MYDSERLRLEILLVSGIHSIALTYEEIAIMRIKQIKDKVFYAREFIRELEQLFAEINLLYKKSILYTQINKRWIVQNSSSTYSTIEKNSKNLLVVMTSNQKLSGNLSEVIMRDFMHLQKNTQADLLIIGHQGLLLSQRLGLKNKEDRYYSYPKTNETLAIYKIAEFMMEYAKVFIVYGRAKTLLTNYVEKEFISGKETTYDTRQIFTTPDYLFEPSIFEVLSFFETQIFALILKQKIFETELANLGSRINAMELAVKNSEDMLSKLHLDMAFVLKSEFNKQQIQRIAGISLWNN